VHLLVVVGFQVVEEAPEVLEGIHPERVELENQMQFWALATSGQAEVVALVTQAPEAMVGLVVVAPEERSTAPLRMLVPEDLTHLLVH
jgi:hypothetical protein